MVMVTSLFLVIVTVFKGFTVEENPLFVLTESVLNFVIIVDFVCRIRLVGFRRFFLGQQSAQTVGNLVQGDGRSKIRLWNWVDAIVVLGSFVLFLAIAI